MSTCYPTFRIKTVETCGDSEKATDFRYDNNGSQVSKLISETGDAGGGGGIGFTQAGAGGGISYELSGYDAFGRLVSVRNDKYSAAYTYNADGLRISKDVTESGATTTAKFLYEGGLAVLELDASGNQTAYNVYGDESIISRTTAQGTDYYLYNGRGDVVQLTTAWGAVSAAYDYDAFGNPMEASINDTNPFRYCGEYWDDESMFFVKQKSLKKAS